MPHPVYNDLPQLNYIVYWCKTLVLSVRYVDSKHAMSRLNKFLYFLSTCRLYVPNLLLKISCPVSRIGARALTNTE